MCLNRQCQNVSVFGVHECSGKCNGRGVSAEYTLAQYLVLNYALKPVKQTFEESVCTHLVILTNKIKSVFLACNCTKNSRTHLHLSLWVMAAEMECIFTKNKLLYFIKMNVSQSGTCKSLHSVFIYIIHNINFFWMRIVHEKTDCPCLKHCNCIPLHTHTHTHSHSHTYITLPNHASLQVPKCLLTWWSDAKECPWPGGRDGSWLYVCAKCKSHTAAPLPLHLLPSSILLHCQLDCVTSPGNPPGSSDFCTGNPRLPTEDSWLHAHVLSIMTLRIHTCKAGVLLNWNSVRLTEWERLIYKK